MTDPRYVIRFLLIAFTVTALVMLFAVFLMDGAEGKCWADICGALKHPPYRFH